MMPARLTDDDFDTAPPLPTKASRSLITEEPLPVSEGVAEGTRKRKRKSPLTDLANQLGRELLERQEARRASGEAPVRLSPGSSTRPRRPTLTDFIASEERAKAEQEECERVRKIEERQYRRERVRAGESLEGKRPQSAGSSGVTCGAAKGGEDGVAQEQEREKSLALVSERAGRPRASQRRR